MKRFRVTYSNRDTGEIYVRWFPDSDRNEVLKKIAATVNQGWKFAVSKRSLRD